MPRCKFVQPAIVRLPTSDGDWLDVKEQLTVGERAEMFAQIRRDMVADYLKAGRARDGLSDYLRDERPPAGVVLRARIQAYVLAWSYVGPDGRPVDISAGALDQLKGWAFDEILAALDAHDSAIAAREEAEKNWTDGASVSSPISSSVA